MKTRLIFLVLLIACLSCGTNNKPVSDAQKEKIKGDLKEVVNTIIKGAEEANFDMAMSPWFDSPDFSYINNGKAYTYKEVIDGFSSMFNTLQNQKGTIVEEKYAVLDNSTALYTVNSKWLMNFKDGHSVLQDPWIVQFTFKKIDNKWRVINGVESGFEKVVKASEAPKELDQVELHKQLIGNWKGEVAKDTICFMDVKSYGIGFEGYFKYVTQGKIVMEGKFLWGYDKNLDKFNLSEMIKGMDNVFYSSWFTSKNKCAVYFNNDISNLDNASTKWEMEFTSPDMFSQTTIVNNKPVKIDTFTRIK